MEAVAKDCVEYLDWYLALDADKQSSVADRIGDRISMLYQLLHICDEAKQKTLVNKYLPHYIAYSKKLRI
jgi:hypothetical protein